MTNEVFGIAVETWGAVGNLATAVGVGVAGLGSWLAYGQLREGKATRFDQNRPYVLVTIERSEAEHSFIEIVVRNVGAGPAHNVQIDVDPPLQRAAPRSSNHGPAIGETRYFNDHIPLMPPGYELRIFFDSMIHRCEAVPPLPDRYQFTVSYDDGHGHAFAREHNIADIELLHELSFAEVYTEHHSAKALREIKSLLQRSPLVKGTVEVTLDAADD